MNGTFRLRAHEFQELAAPPRLKVSKGDPCMWSHEQ